MRALRIRYTHVLLSVIDDLIRGSYTCPAPMAC